MQYKQFRKVGLVSFSIALFNYKNKLLNNQAQNSKTFLWGNGIFQARSDGTMNFDNFEPKHIQTFTDENALSQLAFHDNFSAGINKSGDLIIWENHKLANTYDPLINDNVRKIKKISENQNIIQIGFTKGFLFGLKKDGQILQWSLNIVKNEAGYIEKAEINENPRQVQSLQNIIQFSTGFDHLIALNEQGQVFSMGDDTFGQCGVDQMNRDQSPPFIEQRIRKAGQVQDLPKIKKVVCGGYHSLALSENGELFGWGSNSRVQLSYELEQQQVEKPALAFFKPVKLAIQNNEIQDMTAGNEFTIIVTNNKCILYFEQENNETEVFGCGHNEQGELGIGSLKQYTDITKLDGLSNYTIGKEKKPVRIEKISCGYHHCMALMSVGAIMEWGYNEQGQMGNKRRIICQNPIIISKFLENNILNIQCGSNKSGVIIE